MTSIDYLIQELKKGYSDDYIHNVLIKQAKEMHKQEQEKLVDDALINYGIGYNSPKVENKTSFGEISDEEIWEASINYDNGATYETPIVHFQQGAFWYREQLKNR